MQQQSAITSSPNLPVHYYVPQSNDYYTYPAPAQFQTTQTYSQSSEYNEDSYYFYYNPWIIPAQQNASKEQQMNNTSNYYYYKNWSEDIPSTASSFENNHRNAHNSIEAQSESEQFDSSDHEINVTDTNQFENEIDNYEVHGNFIYYFSQSHVLIFSLYYIIINSQQQQQIWM